MRFNPKARLDTRQVPTAAGGGWRRRRGGGGMRLPIPGGHQGRRRHRRHRRDHPDRRAHAVRRAAAAAARRRHRRTASQLQDAGGDSDRYDRVQDRRRRQQNPDCARLAVVNSHPGLLGQASSPAQAGTELRRGRRPSRSPAAIDTGCGAASSHGRARSTARQDDSGLPRHHVLRRRARGAARRAGRRLRRGLRARPRVRPPHPEPDRHHGPGPHPAGARERRRPPRAAGRLLRRHVGPGTPPRPRTPTARC